MDWISVKSKGLQYLKKYRYILIVLLTGIFLMALPEKKTEVPEPAQTTQAAEPGLQEALSQILSKTVGAGKVEVLLTQSQGTQTIYQMDEDRTVGETTTDTHKKTVIVSNSGREETGLIKQVNPPAYQGAIILCQGGDDAKIRLAIVEAVAGVTGLSADKITVLKMK